METATRVLVVGGISVLAYGLLLGNAVVRARTKSPQTPRHLMIAHLASIIQGTMLLALTAAVRFSTLSPDLETAATAILLGGVVLFGLGNTLNWLQGIGDSFRERPLGWKLLATSTPPILAGVGILLVGVVRAA